MLPHRVPGKRLHADADFGSKVDSASGKAQYQAADRHHNNYGSPPRAAVGLSAFVFRERHARLIFYYSNVMGLRSGRGFIRVLLQLPCPL